ncbi:MAG: hypothetical protein IJ164_04390, partial [Duodenibacillus sp.]|nr:hypothetical protein [Duodenibacillus sp.]
MLDDVSRRAGPYQGGTRYFSFDFKVFQETDVAVMVSSDGAAGETALVYGTDYSVELNADQDATPGGLVVLTSALESTKVLAIVSAIPYTQPTQLTNYSRFPPEILNKSLDRLEAQIQQLVEKTARTVTVPATSETTSKELIATLFEGKEEAEKLLEHTTQIDRLYESADNIDTVANHIGNVDAVVGHIGNVDTVALRIANVDRVALSANNVDTVANHVASVDTVAGHAANVDIVADHISSVDTVAGI